MATIRENSMKIKKLVKTRLKYKLKIKNRKIRTYGNFYRNIKSKNYLKNNSIETIILPGKWNGINIIGDMDYKEIKNRNIKIDELKNSLNLANISKKKIKIGSAEFFGNQNNIPIIFKIENKKILYINYKINSNSNSKNELKRIKLLISLKDAIKADFTIVYIKNKNHKIKNKTLQRTCGKMGADYIIFSSDTEYSHQHIIKQYRADKYTYIIKAMGKFINQSKIGSFVHVNVNLKNIYELSEFYIPIKSTKNNIIYLNYEKNKKEITKIEKFYKTLPLKENVIYFEDIFKIAKYK